MKYLKISNKGELDLRLIALMGGTTKAEDTTKIGQFGTGLKYAIAYLIRTATKFRLFIGEQEVVIHSAIQEIVGKSFEEIYCNGESMKITTRYGYQWKAWEAIREIWCNAVDEGDSTRNLISSKGHIKGKESTTTFYIEVTDEIKEVVENWDSYFLNGTPLYEDDKIAIYPNSSSVLKLYKNKVLIQTSDYYNSLFIYDFKNAELNELRQYRGYLTADIGKALLSSSKPVVKLMLDAIASKAKVFEVDIDWSYISFDKAKVKQIFSGYLFLHPSSSLSSKGKSIVVSETLFTLLQNIGLPCEKVRKSSGGYYGGGGMGYSENDEITYKEVYNSELQERIEDILFKYNCNTKFIIAVQKDKSFEILLERDKIIFNSELDKLSIPDLESIVLIAIFHTQEGNVYKAFRRLIKIVMGNRNFRRILFGDGPKNKPREVVKKEIDIWDDENLPF